MHKALTAVSLSFLFLFTGCARKTPAQDSVHISLVAKRYEFVPNVIRVKKGQSVTLEISTADVQHGFRVKELGIDESIQKGRPATVTFKADKAGEFTLECDVVCGRHHDDMTGKIIVE